MSSYDDTMEVVGYAVMMLQGFDEDDYSESHTMDSCRRLYDKAVKVEATRMVDNAIREFEKTLATEGKRLTDRAGWRKTCIENTMKDWKSFDEWRNGF